MGRALTGAGQIPVSRGTRDHSSLDLAIAALERGEVIVVYPEGTVTGRDDGLADAGEDRSSSGSRSAPVCRSSPMASWGSRAVWQKTGRGSLKFGRPIWTSVGEPLALPADPEGGQVELRALTGGGDGGDHAPRRRSPRPLPATMDEVGCPP